LEALFCAAPSVGYISYVQERYVWRLPGDIFIQMGTSQFLSDDACIVVSIVLTILLNVFFRR
jgi:hypothetical protein